MIRDVRPSPIAGQWYPDDSEVLASIVDHMLDEGARTLPTFEGEVIGLIAPHAGIRYSGRVAGRAFAAVRRKTYDLVALVGPMHYPYTEPILTTAHDAYETPLGEIPVDHHALQRLNARLQERLDMRLTYVYHDPEHALEMELPFLQRALASSFRLLPLMLRTVDPLALQVLGEVLAEEVAPSRALLVASTDLSHYFPEDVARRLDREMIRRIEALDPKGVLQAEEEGKAYACGRAAVAAILWAAQVLGVNRVISLGYATSGETSGDYRAVVGYYAAALVKESTS